MSFVLGYLNIPVEEEEEMEAGELRGQSGPSSDESQGPSPAAGMPEQPHGPKKKVGGEPKRPSLAKMILALDSVSAQQRALQQILNTIQILSAREAIVAALLPAPAPTSDQREEELPKSFWRDVTKSMDTSILSPSSLIFSLEDSVKEDGTGQGGGEAQASQA